MTESAGEVHRVHLIRVVTLVAEQLPAVDYRPTFAAANTTPIWIRVWPYQTGEHRLQIGTPQRSPQSRLRNPACELASKPAGAVDDQRQRHPGYSHALLEARLQLIRDFT
jgi:hypothetical protein